MNEYALSLSSFREYFAKILQGEGFDVRVWPLVGDAEPVVLAENPYYLIAFQVFDLWPDLISTTRPIELALSELVGKQPGNGKAWDAYLVLVCRSKLYDTEEFNQLSDLTYNTRYTRKIVHAGLGDMVTRLEDVARPFVSLTKARSSAKSRDPLRTLEEKMIGSGLDSSQVRKLVTIFKERGGLTGV